MFTPLSPSAAVSCARAPGRSGIGTWITATPERTCGFAARVRRAAFAAAGSLSEAVHGADIVVVATPIATLAAVVAEALEAAPGAVVTDAGSVKAPVVAEVARLAPGLASRFVGGHPMGGS